MMFALKEMHWRYRLRTRFDFVVTGREDEFSSWRSSKRKKNRFDDVRRAKSKKGFSFLLRGEFSFYLNIDRGHAGEVIFASISNRELISWRLRFENLSFDDNCRSEKIISQSNIETNSSDVRCISSRSNFERQWMTKRTREAKRRDEERRENRFVLFSFSLLFSRAERTFAELNEFFECVRAPSTNRTQSEREREEKRMGWENEIDAMTDNILSTHTRTHTYFLPGKRIRWKENVRRQTSMLFSFAL